MMSKALPILFLLVAGGIVAGYVHPTLTGDIANAQREIKKYDAALKASTRYEQKQAQLAAEQQALPDDGVARLEQFLPDNVDNVQLILDLDALASRSGITITNFNTTESVAGLTGDSAETADGSAGSKLVSFDPSKPYESLDLTITASGSYAQMRSFLDGVESSLRPLDLILFQLSDSPTGVYKYQMTFRLYWLP
jgi:Tfp pilus assembly protein PilO